jgi:hypothetical protein
VHLKLLQSWWLKSLMTFWRLRTTLKAWISAQKHQIAHCDDCPLTGCKTTFANQLARWKRKHIDNSALEHHPTYITLIVFYLFLSFLLEDNVKCYLKELGFWISASWLPRPWRDLQTKYGRKLNASYLPNFRNGGSWKTNLNHQRRQPNAIPWPGTWNLEEHSQSQSCPCHANISQTPGTQEDTSTYVIPTLGNIGYNLECIWQQGCLVW